MENAEIARVLEEIGRLLELRGGENPFKTRAYRTAARTIRALDEPIDRIAARGRLESLPGIGSAIAEKIRTFRRTGQIPLHERLRAEIPTGLIALTSVPGLGAKRIRALHETLGIDSVEALDEAARTGRLTRVPGFGPASVARVLSGLERMREHEGRHRLLDALESGERMVRHLDALDTVERVGIAGSVRRRCEVVHDVDLVAVGGDPSPILDAFVDHPAIEEVERRAQASARIRLAGGVPVDLLVAPPGRWASTLIRETGSAGHVARLEDRAGADDRGLESIDADDEEALYRALDLAWIPPELRENRGEIDAAASGGPRLVERSDLRGVIHCHTTWSDGRTSVRGMAEAARGYGYDYLVVCDHSRSATIAGGLSIDELRRQIDEVRRVSDEMDAFDVLAGSEVDLLPDGSLDYPDEVLAELDLVVASVHSAFRRSREEQTERLVRAFANPWLDVLGHPTGRRLLARDGIAVDMERVLDAAAEHGVALEINGDPRRLELDWRWVGEAADRGILLSLDPDAHGPETIEPHHEHALWMARKGGLAPEQVLNARDVAGLRAALRRNRS